MPRHEQYAESLLNKLRLYRLRHPDATLEATRKALRGNLSGGDIDLLFDNWLNANFGRIEIVEKSGTVTATVIPRREVSALTARERAQKRLTEDRIAARVAKDTKENYFVEFAERMSAWVMPNGMAFLECRGAYLKRFGGFVGAVAKKLKPNEKVSNHFNTRDLFNVAQRHDAI